jgi:hypothetical protein
VDRKLMPGNNLKILLIVPPNRKDFYDFLQNDAQNEYILLWCNSRHELGQVVEAIPPFFKDVVYWHDYSNPRRLLQKVKPDKIVLYEIIDQQQVSLIIKARTLGITTFYLEHGAAGDAATALERSKQKDAFNINRTASLLEKLRNSFFSVLRTKYFYYSSVNGIRSFRSFWNFITLPFLQTIYGPNKALRHRIFRERVPDYNIVFNRTNFEQFRLYTGIGEEDAIFTGVPMFDSFYNFSPGEDDYIVYIEQPFLEVGFMGWTPNHHKAVALGLHNFAKERKIKLVVKLHPRSDKKLWDSYNLCSPYFEVLQDGNFTNLYLKSKIILGYSSSLITGLLCAKKNIVLLGWHPLKKITGNDFSQTGLCHVSLDMEDIRTKFDYWLANNLTKKDEEKYATYLFRYNFPFDGQATRRVIESFSKVK